MVSRDAFTIGVPQEEEDNESQYVSGTRSLPRRLWRCSLRSGRPVGSAWAPRAGRHAEDDRLGRLSRRELGQAVREAVGLQDPAKYAASSNEMFALMRSGGGAASTTSSPLRATPACGSSTPSWSSRSTSSVPAWKQFFGPFKSPPNNTVNGMHYGISLQLGPNTCSTTEKVQAGAEELVGDLRLEVQGPVTIPDNPIQIADAALYLMKTKRVARDQGSVRAELEAVRRGRRLLKKQRPLIKKYWVGCGRQRRAHHQRRRLDRPDVAAHDGVAAGEEGKGQGADPEGGDDGLARHVDALGEGDAPTARTSGCRYVSGPEVQALQGVPAARRPSTRRPVRTWTSSRRGRARRTTPNAPLSYYKSMYFWKTPVADCGRRQERLHGLLEVAAGLDLDQGLVANLDG